MKLSLIGMSGVGKTTWADKLEKAGYIRYSCDDIIEKKLSTELKQLGYSGINDLAKWLGQPYEERYKTNAKRYLDLEEESVEEALNRIQSLPENDRFVLDTTGSVIYLSDNLLKRLTQNTTIVYLETPNSMKQEMCDAYFRDPKPVIWNNSYSRNSNEDETDSLRRCYPQLLETRRVRYEQYAEVTLPYDFIWNEYVGVDEFVERVLK